MAKEKTEMLYFDEVAMRCNIESNGCFTLEQDDMKHLLSVLDLQDTKTMRITRKCGEVMKLDHLRARDDRWVIWPVEHQYGKRGEAKKGVEDKGAIR